MAIQYVPSPVEIVDRDIKNEATSAQRPDAETEDLVRKPLKRAVTGLDTTPVFPKFLQDEFHPGQ